MSNDYNPYECKVDKKPYVRSLTLKFAVRRILQEARARAA